MNGTTALGYPRCYHAIASKMDSAVKISGRPQCGTFVFENKMAELTFAVAAFLSAKTLPAA
jgi:hypothetical protein